MKVAKEKYRVLNEKHDELMKKLDDMNLELKTAFFAREMRKRSWTV